MEHQVCSYQEVCSSILNDTFKSIACLISVDPNIVHGPDSLTVLEFDYAMLTCTFTGNPAPSITWEREGMDSFSNEIKSRLTINETSILNSNLYTVRYSRL